MLAFAHSILPKAPGSGAEARPRHCLSCCSETSRGTKGRTVKLLTSYSYQTIPALRTCRLRHPDCGINRPPSLVDQGARRHARPPKDAGNFASVAVGNELVTNAESRTIFTHCLCSERRWHPK